MATIHGWFNHIHQVAPVCTLHPCFLEATQVHNPSNISIGSSGFALFVTECPYTLQRPPITPSKLPPCMGSLEPHLIHPWAHPSPQPKLHLDQFSNFCRAHNHDRQTDRWTDRATVSVTVGLIYVHSTVMHPKNKCCKDMNTQKSISDILAVTCKH